MAWCLSGARPLHVAITIQFIDVHMRHQTSRLSTLISLIHGLRTLLNPYHNQLETNGSILSIVATDSLVLKHQAISINNTDEICVVSDHFYTVSFAQIHLNDYSNPCLYPLYLLSTSGVICSGCPVSVSSTGVSGFVDPAPILDRPKQRSPTVRRV